MELTEEVKEYINALLSKSEEAYLMALEIINKPTINYRSEGFCFFICNSWELLLKAFLIRKNNDINFINFKDDTNRTIGLDECVEKVFTSTTDKTKINISYIRSIRNKATHLIIPDYDFLLASAYQRCITNFNKFFENQFPEYNLNKKVTPFVALTNPGNLEKSSLVLNPANIFVYEKLMSELNMDESITQTLRLISTKKTSEADITYAIDKNATVGATFIDVPKDIDKTHPFTTKEVVSKICETLSLTIGVNHGFTNNKFHDICKRKNVKLNQEYCYQFPYSKSIIYKYSELAIEYICSVYINEKEKSNKN
ncbi:MAG: DUF3644 domain-containing protein [Bacilli bacterium]